MIERCIEAVGLDNATTRDTPSRPGIPLVRDDEGEPALGDFNYASVVGMLMYLAGHTRPDIAYAVNCCARYMFNPKRSHEEAVKRIVRYLKATKDRGMIFDPTEDFALNCYPDADFAGMYGHERPDDPRSQGVQWCGSPSCRQKRLSPLWSQRSLPYLTAAERCSH